MSEPKTFTKAQWTKDPSRVLEEALASGKVRVRDENGHTFVVRSEERSPMDVPVVDLGFCSADEIVRVIREDREQASSWEKEADARRPKRASRKNKTAAAKRNVKPRRGAA